MDVREGGTGIRIEHGTVTVDEASGQTELRWPLWRSMPPTGDIYELFAGQVRLPPHLIGRETELQNLLDWARTRDAPSLMWLSGPAGIGKTRLAAELCERLAEENWTVGFIDIGTAPHFPEAPQGLLLVLDYPEENQAGTLAWLKALAGVPARPAPIRIVFLSRGGPNNPENDWTYQLRLARISYLCRAADHLGVLSASQCQRLVREVVYYAQRRIRYIMRGRSLCAVRTPPARVRSRAC